MMISPYTTTRGNPASSLLLDANEHYKQWVNITDFSLRQLNRYPDRQAIDFRKALIQNYLPYSAVGQVWPTAGSIEAIDLVLLALRPSQIMINTPGYDVYNVRAQIHNVPVLKIPLMVSGQPNLHEIMKSATKDSLLVLINPNNPTGSIVHPLIGDELLTCFPGIIVVDEAYIEFASKNATYATKLQHNSKLIIFRTFSKAWGLAGVRLGYIIANATLLQYIIPYQNPYSVSRFALSVGIEALDQVAGLQHQIDKILFNKTILKSQLEIDGHIVQDTHANFLLIKLTNADEIHRKLVSKGIYVRPRPYVEGAANYLRVTVGSKAHNTVFLNAFREAMYERSPV